MVLPGTTKLGDLRISDGIITEVSELGTLENRDGEMFVDGTGLHLLPGCIDPQVHFRDPGQPEKEDLGSGSAAAVSGGITSFLDMPNLSLINISEPTRRTPRTDAGIRWKTKKEPRSQGTNRDTAKKGGEGQEPQTTATQKPPEEKDPKQGGNRTEANQSNQNRRKSSQKFHLCVPGPFRTAGIQNALLQRALRTP